MISQRKFPLEPFAAKLLLKFSLVLLFYACSIDSQKKFSETSPPSNGFLKNRCFSCHKAFSEDNVEHLIRKGYLVPGRPELSRLFQFSKNNGTSRPGNMPPIGMPSVDEMRIFSTWIGNLARSGKEVVPPLASLSDNTTAVMSPIDPLDELEVYQRCYFQFTRSRVPASDPTARKIIQKEITGADGCLNLLSEVHIDDEKGENLHREGKARGQILEVFQAFHNNWFNSFDFFFGNSDTGTFEVLDPGIMGLYFTRNLFQEKGESGLKSIFSENRSLEAIRKYKRKNEFSVHPLQKMNLSDATFLTGKNGVVKRYWHPKLVERGDLTDIHLIPKRRDVLPMVAHYTDNQKEARSNTVSEVNKDIHEIHGGGPIGSEEFIILNNGLGLGESSDGGIKVPRLWGKAIIETFLCRELPVITTEDANQFVQPESKLPFRKNQNCMSCHATMDYMSYVLRNYEKVYSNPLDSEKGKNIRSMHLYEHKAVLNSKYFDFSYHPDADPEFHKRPTAGEFIYRTSEGEFRHEQIRSIDDVGKILANLDDFYFCVAKRYLHFLTGIEVDLENDGRGEQKERYLMNFVKYAGRNLRKHQSLKLLIREIIQSPIYRDINFNFHVRNN